MMPQTVSFFDAILSDLRSSRLRPGNTGSRALSTVLRSTLRADADPTAR
jgi:hypothetical protein